jgi:hypothetical protein
MASENNRVCPVELAGSLDNRLYIVWAYGLVTLADLLSMRAAFIMA